MNSSKFSAHHEERELLFMEGLEVIVMGVEEIALKKPKVGGQIENDNLDDGQIMQISDDQVDDANSASRHAINDQLITVIYLYNPT